MELKRSRRAALPLIAALAFAGGMAACGDDTIRGVRPGDGAGDAVGGDGVGGEDTPGGPGDGCIDRDGDGYGEGCALGPDCNDVNPAVNPGMPEICGDRFDNNCNGLVDEGCPCVDGQSETCYEGEPALRGVGQCRPGLRFCSGDTWGECSHGEPSDEICDGIDNNCNGVVDEGVTNACGTCGPTPLEVCGNFLDDDCNGLIDDAEGCTCDGRQNQPCYSGRPLTLGFGICRGGIAICENDRIVSCVGEVLPDVEVCDGIDNDCDGAIDEGLANACGVCGAPEPVEVCDGIDNDCDGLVDEGLTNLCGSCGGETAEEVCGDDLDNDCDGQVDEGCPCFLGTGSCWTGPPGVRGVGQCRDGTRACDITGEFWEPCTGAILPGPEVCDGLDNDCDGAIDEGPNGCSVCGGEPEICDGRDNDCDGQVDENLRNACGQCIEDVRPEELCGPACCDGVDNDCDGLVDEGLVNICGSCDEPCFQQTYGTPPSTWQLGELEGLTQLPSGGLRISARVGGLPYLWVANSGEATVSRINTETFVEEGRFPVGDSPSRTAVDFEGNVYVANRAFAGQGSLTRVNPSGCAAGDCVEWEVPVGPRDSVPRGVAVDASGNVWVGSYNDLALRRIDPATGAVLDSFLVNRRVYGIAIDSEGIVWFTNLEIPQFTGGRLGAFDPRTRRVIGEWTIPGCSNPYGIAVDRLGNIWLGNFTCNNLVRFNRTTRDFSVFTDPALDRTRGVAVDADGFVWVASYGSNRVAKFNPTTNSFVGTYPVCTGPIGIGISDDNHVWVPCYGSDNVHRLSPDGVRTHTIAVGRQPYSYSDLTGFQLRNFTSRRGDWRVRFDCGDEAATCRFHEIVIDGEIPPTGAIQISARVSSNGTNWSPWLGPIITNPADLNLLTRGRFLEVEIGLRTSEAESSPVLREVNILWSMP